MRKIRPSKPTAKAVAKPTNGPRKARYRWNRPTLVQVLCIGIMVA